MKLLLWRFPFANIHDFKNYIFAVSPPGQCMQVFLVTQLNKLPAVQFKHFGQTIGSYAKFEFIALNSPGSVSFDPGLDNFTFPCFEHISLMDNKIQVAGLDPFAKNKEIPDIKKYNQKNQYSDYSQ